MKRSISRWTTAAAVAALLALPATGIAQTTQPSSPAPTATTSTQQPAGASAQHGSADAHLQKAKDALNGIPAASLTGTTKTRVAELKRHLSALEKAGSTGAAGDRATAKSGKWDSEVAAADRILTELLGAQGTTGAGATQPTGTSGTTPSASTKGKSSQATLDASARAKLEEVRTHITAFAAAMANPSASSGKSDDSASTSTPRANPSSAPAPNTAAGTTATAQPASAPDAAAPAPAATAEAATPAPQAPAAAETASAAPGTPTTPNAAGAATAEPSASASAQAAGATPPAPASAAQADPNEVKRHVTAARDVLSQLTQLPAAAQLTGDARAQVSQLISNFNELITTNVEWRASYSKVEANLNALIGSQQMDESPAPTAGTAGAVGTSGTVEVDPTIRAKLVEFRKHLAEFEKAASGADAAATAAPSTTATPSSATMAEASGSMGSAAGTTGVAGTSGSNAKDDSSQTAQQKTPAGSDTKSTSNATAGHGDAMRHIEAIETILDGRASGAAGATAGTSGSRNTAGAASSLDSRQISEIKTHLAELRKALNASGGR